MLTDDQNHGGLGALCRRLILDVQVLQVLPRLLCCGLHGDT